MRDRQPARQRELQCVVEATLVTFMSHLICVLIKNGLGSGEWAYRRVSRRLGTTCMAAGRRS